MRKISEILRLRYELNCSYREIARSQNISVTTISEYMARAKIAGIKWPLPEDMTEEDLYKKLFLPSESACKNKPLPDWEMDLQRAAQKRRD